MNEGRLKECWERTKDNGVLCRAGCIICVMAPCIEPCLFCCPAGEPIKIEREDPNRPDWLVKIPNPDFPKKALWAIDEGACRAAWQSNLRRVRPESPRRPPRHLHDTCSMLWRCQCIRRTG